MSTSVLDKLLTATDYESATWRPIRAGDLIAGKCLVCHYQETVHGEKLLIKVDASKVVADGVDLPAGIYSIWEKSQLRQIAEEQRLRPGDNLALRLTREAATKFGGKKKIFAAVVERTEDSETWKPLDAPPPKDFDDDIPFKEPKA